MIQTTNFLPRFMTKTAEAASAAPKATRAEQIQQYVDSIPKKHTTAIAGAISGGELKYLPAQIKLPYLNPKEYSAVIAAYQAVANTNPEIAITFILQIASDDGSAPLFVTIDNTAVRQSMSTAEKLTALTNTGKFRAVQKPVEEDPAVAAAIEASLFGDTPLPPGILTAETAAPIGEPETVKAASKEAPLLTEEQVEAARKKEINDKIKRMRTVDKPAEKKKRWGLF